MAMAEAAEDPGQVRRRWRLLAVVLLSQLLLSACNPISTYRDAVGISKNDPGEDAPNTQNLEAGGKQPYPNLASVPPPPTRALSTEEREALTQKLIADRANAKYLDEELRVGPGPAAPPPRLAAVPPAAFSVPGSAPSAPDTAPAAEAAPPVPAPP